MNQPSLDINGGVILLKGQVTIATVPALYDDLQKILASSPGGAELTLNCADMDMADSAAIALLVEAHQQASAAGNTLAIVGLKDQLVSLIKIYGVEWILPN
ncbi:MAG: STAS domain-containing protein [Porticoccaceae bacterium]|nr:STAS domain-containing protein [Porticoccaceae bacterium]